MRIVFHSRYPSDEDQPRGGVETATLNLLRGLKRIGFSDLHVVTFERDCDDPTVEERQLATVHRLPRSAWPMVGDVFLGPGRSRLGAYISGLRPDIVHFHETHGLGSGDWSVPSVFTVHGFDSLNLPTEQSRAWRLRSRLWQSAENIGLRRQRNLISIAEYVTKQIKPRTSARVFEIPNAIAAEGFEIDRRENAGQIFFAGWINPRKNAVGLIKSFAIAAKKCPSAILRVAGEFSDADYKAKVITAIAESGLQNRVTLLGRISANDMRNEFATAAAFVLPSYQENAPMVVSEAMAAGVPVVTSNVCGMPDMVDDRVTGYLFEPDDHEGFGHCIAELVEDDELRTGISDAAKAVAFNTYHPESVAGKTIEVYKRVIAEYSKIGDAGHDT